MRYLGSSTHNASQNTVTVTVAKAEPTVKVKHDKAKAGAKTKVVANVSALGYDVTGKVKFVARLIGGKQKVADTVEPQGRQGRGQAGAAEGWASTSCVADLQG